MPEVGAPGTGRQTSNSAPPNYHVMNRFERDLQQGRMWEELDGSAGEGETRVWCKFREMQGRYGRALAVRRESRDSERPARSSGAVLSRSVPASRYDAF